MLSQDEPRIEPRTRGDRHCATLDNPTHVISSVMSYILFQTIKILVEKSKALQREIVAQGRVSNIRFVV
jgi:hypothetical protein